MKTTILAQTMALDFALEPKSGFEFTQPDWREALTVAILKFFGDHTGPDLDDREQALRLALRLCTGANKKMEMKLRIQAITDRAQSCLDWEIPKPPAKPAAKPAARTRQTARQSRREKRTK